MSDTRDPLTAASNTASERPLDGTPSKRAPDQLVVATFNVLHGRRPHGPVDLHGLSNAIASLHANVVGLQEVDCKMLRSHRQDQAARLGELGSLNANFASARRRWDLGRFGNALLSDSQIEEFETIRLPRTHWRKERRVAAVGKVSLAGRRWTCASTHLSLDPTESAKQLTFLLSRLGTREGPKVILGDFNLAPELAIPLAQSAGWTVVETGSTIPSWKPERRVDYVVLKGASATASAVHSFEVSDHCAVIAEVRATDE